MKYDNLDRARGSGSSGESIDEAFNGKFGKGGVADAVPSDRPAVRFTVSGTSLLTVAESSETELCPEMSPGRKYSRLCCAEGGDPLRDEGNCGRCGTDPDELVGCVTPPIKGEDAEEPIEPPLKWPDERPVPSWFSSRDFVEIILPLDSGSSLGRFASNGCPCLALKSARYAIYSLYFSVLRYADSSTLYLSLATLD